MSKTPGLKPDPLLGTTIDGKYKILDRLAGGGMGVVYEAQHEWMERRVALKVLHRHLADNQDYVTFLKRFKREAQLASKITHPNAVTLYDFGIVDEMPYLAMQFIEGRNLRALIAEEGPLAIKRSIDLMKQVCSATCAAHDLNIIHRDLKPDNIMISRAADGAEIAHVLDFGVAKVTNDDGGTSGAMTMAGKTVGTPRYMSPEQILAKDLDARTDIYALAVVLYEMLSGDIPFEANSSMQLMFHHINTKPRSFNKELKIPRALEAVVLKALAKEKEKRQATVAEFAAELEKAITPKPRRKSASETLAPMGVKAAQVLETARNAVPQINPTRKQTHLTVGVLATILLGILALTLFPKKESELIVEKTTPTVLALDRVSTESKAAKSDATKAPASTDEDFAKGAATTESAPKVKEQAEKIDHSKQRARLGLIQSPEEAISSIEEPATLEIEHELQPLILPEAAEQMLNNPPAPDSQEEISMLALENDVATDGPKSTASENEKLSETQTTDDATASKESENAEKLAKENQPKPAADSISSLIEKLASENRKERETAAIALQNMGNKPVTSLYFCAQTLQPKGSLLVFIYSW